MAPLAGILAALDRQRGHLLPWLPVALGTGVAVYFALPREPGPAVLASLALAGIAGWIAAWRLMPRLAPVVAALALVALGLTLAATRAHLVAAPVLDWRYYGPVEGRVVAIDRSLSDKIRLTLDRVALPTVAPARRPARVRVALHGAQGVTRPEPGMTVMMTAHLAAPGGPVEPGGFDFRRHAWFQGIGAVGYTRVPVLAVAPAEAGATGPVWLARLRFRLGQAVRAALPGEPGAFAAAIMTGDRSGIARDTLQALRLSNLAHLLAISGLHMGLLTGFVFAALRLAMALVPPLALTWPIKKIAAGAALAAGAVYYALSGGNVATERAFVMVAVVLVAVMLERRALTIRAVAVAATIVLVLRPETLTSPGFQMSFAATAALVGAFSALRDWDAWSPPRWARAPLAVVISSAVAGLATAPVAAAHFNRIADYGLIANLLSVPLMGLVVMPAAVMAAVLAPFGLGWIGLAAMKPAILWILAVAHRVAATQGAVTQVPAPPHWVLPVLALGGLAVLLWQGRGRHLGWGAMLAAALGWSQAERPVLLVSGDAGLVGLMTPAGRALSKPRGAGFAARIWLENDGDAAAQDQAAARDAFQGPPGDRRFTLGPLQVAHLTGRGAADRLGAACESAALVILAATAEAVPGGCRVIDRTILGRTGAIALSPGTDSPRMVTAAARAGARLWNAPPAAASPNRR